MVNARRRETLGVFFMPKLKPQRKYGSKLKENKAD